MKIVVQCAGSKDPLAGFFITASGQRIEFVAHPETAPHTPGLAYAHPDGDSDQEGQSWRSLVAEYNLHQGNNPFGLFPAYQLYSNEAYRALVARFGSGQVFVLSACWGLIRSDFLTPHYNLTLKPGSEPHIHRRLRDRYSDFRQLEDSGEEVVFFGGKNYLPLFCELTDSFRSRRIVFYNSDCPPFVPGCALRRYPTTIRTNWHYACARDFAAGEIGTTD
jgi:hypothetical protein